MFAPIPLTSERSPLAHAAELARRRMAETQALANPQIRTKSKIRTSAVEKPVTEPAAA
jgi:hypothetical protein